MKNKIEDLRNHLFETLEDLRDKEKPMELDRAQTIAEVAQVIVNTAKVEVDFTRAVGRAPASQFFPNAGELPPLANGAQPGQKTTVHRLK